MMLKFNGKLCKQSVGLSIGNLLSGIVYGIYMHYRAFNKLNNDEFK